MAKAILPSNFSGLDDEPLEIDLKEPWLAATLAWLLPGLGHWYQGRKGKASLFFVCIVGTFVYGLCLGEGKVVYASSPGQDWRWQYYCQLGVGLPAMPALIERSRFQQRKPPLFGGVMHPPSREPTDLKDDSGNDTTQPTELAAQIIAMHPRHEVGTVFTVIAGLLNLLVICDAYAGPLVVLGRASDDSGDSLAGEATPSGENRAKPDKNPADQT